MLPPSLLPVLQLASPLTAEGKSSCVCLDLVGQSLGTVTLLCIIQRLQFELCGHQIGSAWETRLQTAKR